MNDVTPLLRRTPRTLRASLMVLPMACVVIAGCSGGSASTPPKAQGEPPATATATASPTPATATSGPGDATPAASAPPCYDSCGKVEPVLFNVNSNIASDDYTGIRPTMMDLSVDNPGSGVVIDLTWSSWPSAPNGNVPASATASATGKLKSDGQTVTITLSHPIVGDPTIWGTLTLQIPGQHPAVFQYGGLWAGTASGGQTF
jgi:hypothetical protein